jgi:hypothetical protein
MRPSVHGAVTAILFLFTVSVPPAAGEQLPLPEPPPAEGASPASPGPADGPVPGDSGTAEREDRKLRWRNAAAIGGIVLAVGAYGTNKWWDEDMDSRPSTRHEGWFGQGTYAGGADKLGHAFITYSGTRLLTSGFEALGNERPRALRLAAWTSFGVMTGVEAVDSFSKKWRFSYEDVTFNAAGVGLALLLEKYPSIDAILDFRLLYRQSADARRAGDFDPIGDYSGQTYLLAFKADGLPSLRNVPLVRYLELLVGYGTRGYEPAVEGNTDRQRRIYYGVGINLSRLLGDTLFRGRLGGGKVQRATDTFLELIEVPGTAALTYERL